MVSTFCRLWVLRFGFWSSTTFLVLFLALVIQGRAVSHRGGGFRVWGVFVFGFMMWCCSGCGFRGCGWVWFLCLLWYFYLIFCFGFRCVVFLVQILLLYVLQGPVYNFGSSRFTHTHTHLSWKKRSTKLIQHSTFLFHVFFLKRILYLETEVILFIILLIFELDFHVDEGGSSSTRDKPKRCKHVCDMLSFISTKCYDLNNMLYIFILAFVECIQMT